MEIEREVFIPTITGSEIKSLEEYSNGEIKITKNIEVIIFNLKYRNYEWSIVKTYDEFLSLSKSLSKLAKNMLIKPKKFISLSSIEKVSLLESFMREVLSQQELFEQSTLKEFLDVSFLSFQGVVIKRKEGSVKKQTGGRVGNEKRFCNCKKHYKRFQKR